MSSMSMSWAIKTLIPFAERFNRIRADGAMGSAAQNDCRTFDVILSLANDRSGIGNFCAITTNLLQLRANCNASVHFGNRPQSQNREVKTRPGNVTEERSRSSFHRKEPQKSRRGKGTRARCI